MPVFHTCLRASVWSKNKGEAAGPGGQSPWICHSTGMLYKPTLNLHLVRRCLPQTKVSETSAIPVKVPVIPVFFFFKEKDTNLSYLFRESNMSLLRKFL